MSGRASRWAQVSEPVRACPATSRQVRRPAATAVALASRVGLLALACFGAAGCTGCHRDPEPYPATFEYQARQDWIVVQLPTNVPATRGPDGELEEEIRRINDRGGRVLDPANVPAPLRDALTNYLAQAFGTPAEPTITGDDETRSLAVELGLTPDRLAEGSKLFRARCQECHGPTGDGRGLSARWLNPFPRDFRQGAFKFTSTGRKPTRADLFRTLTYGLPTTPMPSFGMLPEEVRHRLIDYVMFLSLRGRIEFEVLRTLLVAGEDGLDGEVPTEAARVLKTELKAWAGAEREAVPAVPPEYAPGSPEQAEAVRHGHALFLDAKGAACASCHTNYGREAKLQYDVWGTLVRPANLTEPRRKGGEGPAELYRRVRCGIPPSNMPAPTGLTNTQAFDVVQFLLALPYPDRLPTDVQVRVYPDDR
ncbi:MAG TPA: c-type cytochrome [Gemmataceae bacterium]|nr:c-type cytochrome [Gemmataceae bacterium]